MNRQIRALGIFLTICYLALFANLNWIQVFNKKTLDDHPENSGPIQREFNRPRGAIVSADGVILAQSISTPGGSFDRRRVYPTGDLFGQVTGYFSFLYGASGIEKQYNDELAGSTFQQQVQGLGDLFSQNELVGNVVLTARADLQRTARDALGDRQGSVVALDPRTGEILALWSNPSFDPTPLADPDTDVAKEAWALMNLAPGKPLLPKTFAERYFPGSTFKVVTGSTGLQSGKVTVDDPSYPVERFWVPPQTTTPLSNFAGEACGGTLIPILVQSCNTAFARMGVETLGPQPMIQGAESFGFNSVPPIDLPGAVPSVFPTDFRQDLPKLAQASIGQNDVSASPLQMALVAACIADGGTIMAPHLLREVRDSNGDVVKRFEPKQWLRPLDPDKAATMDQAMQEVVARGTATTVRIPGVTVGAKTGTAQLGVTPPRSHTWMIAYAGPPGQPPTVAVAVVVLDQPGTGDATGGAIAGPVAKAVLQAALTMPPADQAAAANAATTTTTSTPR